MKYKIKHGAVVKRKGSFYGWLDDNKEFKMIGSGLVTLAPVDKEELHEDDFVITALDNIEVIEDETK